jgi:chorismate lyase/3-hydroxybenzoate synthase
LVGEALLSVDYLAEVPADGVTAVATLPMRQLEEGQLHEVWQGGDVFFGTYVAEDDDDIERVARVAYDEILRTTRDRGYPHLLRVWNHVRDINGGDGEAERYKRFCVGRHDAFDAAQWPNDRLPAASAIGIHRRGLYIHYLAAQVPGRQIENPRQISAYDYPRQYGRRSPSFARATVFGGTLFVAGTSSIVGHETRHAGDIGAQLAGQRRDHCPRRRLPRPRRPHAREALPPQRRRRGDRERRTCGHAGGEAARPRSRHLPAGAAAGDRSDRTDLRSRVIRNINA